MTDKTKPAAVRQAGSDQYNAQPKSNTAAANLAYRWHCERMAALKAVAP